MRASNPCTSMSGIDKVKQVDCTTLLLLKKISKREILNATQQHPSMGKVTYAIGFRNELPYQNEVKQQRRMYNSLREKGHSLSAAEAARQLAETLLDQGDELIAMNDSITAQRKSLESALRYCDEARNIFNELDNQKERIRYILYNIWSKGLRSTDTIHIAWIS